MGVGRFEVAMRLQCGPPRMARDGRV